MKAIETRYKGYRFRSRLEARWAVFLDVLGVVWEYEKEGFELDQEGKYLPDFWLPKEEFWLEIKGEKAAKKEIEKVKELSKLSGHRAAIAMGSIGNHSWIIDPGYYWDQGTFDMPINLPQDSLLGNLFKVTEEAGIFFDDFGAVIRCPVSEEDFVMIISVNIVKGDEHERFFDDEVNIDMECSGMHSWTLQFSNHNGYGFYKIENLIKASDDFGRYLAGWDESRYTKAIEEARSARFEHGETPRPRRHKISPI